jgi:hypothetical protein
LGFLSATRRRVAWPYTSVAGHRFGFKVTQSRDHGTRRGALKRIVPFSSNSAGLRCYSLMEGVLP